MQYRDDRYGNKISVLGYGCMRFMQQSGKIDVDKAEREIMAAFNAGVNYYDTAYIYKGSEELIGQIFEKNGIRQRVYIATKLPHYLIKNEASIEKYFSEQLQRLKTDYVDYYLMHMLSDVKTWERLKELGIEQWINDKKASGAIKQIGFSYHGNSEMFCKLLDAYDWDFCQIQYNYLDENSQAGRVGLNYAASKGIPVIVMEPLRGGRLANSLPEKAVKILESYEIKRTPAEWAFRWLWNQQDVTCVLSGMNSVEMIEENVKNADECRVGEFTDKDEQLLKNVVKIINEKMKVGCTGCGYCMPCPSKVDIPGIFAIYNKRYTDGKKKALSEYMLCTVLRQDSTSASNCIECGKYGDNFKFVINKVKRLMIPYFVFGILYVAPIMQMLGLDKQGYVMYCIKGIGLSYNARHLWYLFALLWIFVFVMFIKKIIQKYPIACVIVSLVIHYIGYKVKLPFQMTEALRYQLFFVLGFVFNQKYESFYKVYVKGKIVGCVLPIMLLGVFVFNPNRLTNITYAVIGILAIICLSVVLQGDTKLQTTTLYNVMKRDAFGIYLFHPMIIYIMFYLLGEFDISPYFLSLLAIGISIIISIVLTEFIRKIKLKVIIGE